MFHTLARHWWLVLLRGVVAVLFGLMAFTLPGLTLFSLVLLWGAYAFADGILALGAAFGAHRNATAAWLVLVGLLGLAAGVMTLFWPHITALVLLLLIASYAIVRGVVEIVGAIHLRRHIDNEWALILGGVLSVLFGIVLLVRPATGALALLWVIGLYAILFGCAEIALSYRLYQAHRAIAPEREDFTHHFPGRPAPQ